MKEDKWDKKNNKNTKNLWSKKKTMKPTQKLAYKMENIKNIRFETIKQKQVYKKIDKKYLFACQYAKALQKRDTLPNLLFLLI